MPTKTALSDHADTKELRRLADRLDGVQNVFGHFAVEDSPAMGGGKRVKLNPNLTIGVKDEHEMKELIAALDAVIAPIVAPYVARYRTEIDTLLHPATKKA